MQIKGPDHDRVAAEYVQNTTYVEDSHLLLSASLSIP